MKNSHKTKKKEIKQSDYHKQALKFVVAILKAEYEELRESNHGMTGEYKNGYFMGFSDAIESIEDLKILTKKK